MKRGRLALVDSLPPEYCTVYHCAGDCGQPHNQKEMILLYFEQQEREASAPRREAAIEVRRKARNTL